MSKKNYQTIAYAAASLCLIALGAWTIYPPSAPLAIGVLLWIDFNIGSAKR